MVYGCGCGRGASFYPLTVHLVALDEILVLLQASGRIRDVGPDVFIQVPAEVLIRHHEEQSVQVVARPVAVYIQSSLSGNKGD